MPPPPPPPPYSIRAAETSSEDDTRGDRLVVDALVEREQLLEVVLWGTMLPVVLCVLRLRC